MKTGFMVGVNLLDDHPVVEPHHEGLFELNVRDALPTVRYIVLHRCQTTLPESANRFLNLVVSLVSDSPV